jgi:2-polyprenyl-3-methyl-5-hydroxy-6-metoxy-1,4-benzoquinol methylase
MTESISPFGKLDHDSARDRVINTYKQWLVRCYCTIRFRIMNMRILEEIGQYLPDAGRILDAGCGFGLFSLYYALRQPSRRMTGFDLSPNRIEMAHHVARALQVESRVSFCVRDVTTFEGGQDAFHAAYMLDILHHVPPVSHETLIKSIHGALVPGGVLILKDIDAFPWWKVLFTWILDILMSPQHPPKYIARTHMVAMLAEAGFDVKVHSMLDILPYPHVLYICRKAGV